MLSLAAVLGACMGSFLNCYAWRIVHNESVLKGRSHCDYCGHVLGFMDLIPVLSYIIHKGRCRWCGKKLSATHVFGEIISALIFSVTLWKFDWSLETIEYWIFASMLLAISFADLEDFLVPDRFIVFGIISRLVFIFISGNVKTELISSLIGGIAVAGGLLIIVLIFEKIIGREAMGGGDIKLIAMTGMYLGWQRNILALFIACVIGIIFGLATQRKRNNSDCEDSKVFPFGPSIALAAWICLIWGDQLINWYLNLLC